MKNLLVIPMVLLMACSKPGGGSAPAKVREGGIVIQEQDGHGLVLSAVDVGYGSWEQATAACDALILEGHDDWRLPTKEELAVAYEYFRQKGLNEIQSDTYWSSSRADEHHIWAKDFGNGRLKQDAVSMEHNQYRAVRDF